MPNALDTMLRLRKVAVDDARRELAALLRAEEAAQADVDAANARITAEAEAAANLAGGDEAVEAFAAWLPTGRARATNARTTHETAENDVSRARAALVLARAEAEAAQGVIDRLDADRRKAEAHQEQRDLDEIATRLARQRD